MYFTLLKNPGALSSSQNSQAVSQLLHLKIALQQPPGEPRDPPANPSPSPVLDLLFLDPISLLITPPFGETYPPKSFLRHSACWSKYFETLNIWKGLFAPL